MSAAPRQRSRCRCMALLNAAGACPYGCRPLTYKQEAKALEMRLRDRERQAGQGLGISREASTAGQHKAGAVWRGWTFGRNAPRRKPA